MESGQKAVILFDGVCNLCNGFVNFVIDRDPEAHFQFASLQSEAGQQILQKHHLPTQAFNTILLYEQGKLFERSEAVLRIGKRLKGLGWLARTSTLFPLTLRDLVYKWVSRNRYRWFGREDSCRVPTPELKARFL